VRLALIEQVPGALPGMSAQASVSTDTRAGAVVVPIQAVTVRNEKELATPGGSPEKTGPQAPPPAPGKKAKREKLQKVVFVVVDGEAKARPVETGLASDTEIEIVSGVNEGDVVVEGPYRVLSRDLADGKKVTVESPDKKVADAGKATADAKAK
jgi:HlyD family secretion protein